MALKGLPRPIRIVGFLCLAAFWVSSGTSVSAQPPDARGAPVDSCWDCHKDDPAGRDHRAGIHYAFGVGCAGCHGGDPTKPRREEAEAEAAGFKARFSVFAIPEMCAKCHGDKEFVKESSSHRDVFEEYKNGFHAEALWGKEEPGAPQCVTCHGSHRVLRVSDPESPAHPSNVNRTCARCHASEKYKRNFGLNPEIPAQVARSVHGPRGGWNPDLNLPTCASCHSAHLNRRPKGKQVFDSCGRCHGPERGMFQKGHPHFDKEVHCSKCHGSHEITPPTPALFRDPKACASCHNEAENPSDPALGYMSRLLQAVRPVEAIIARSRMEIDELLEDGFQPEEAVGRVDRAERALLTDFGRLQHGLHPLRNFRKLEEVRERAKAAEASIAIVRTRHRWTRIALWAGAAYLVLAVGVVGWRRRFR